MKALKFLLQFAIISIFLFNEVQVVVLPQNYTNLLYTTAYGTRYVIDVRYAYTWFQAERECTRLNLQLAVINTQEINTNLVRLLKLKFGYSRNLWIGAHDMLSKDTKRPFYWTPYGWKMEFSNWSGKNPTNTGGVEHCVQIWEDSDNFEWNDRECEFSKSGFICEELDIYSLCRIG